VFEEWVGEGQFLALRFCRGRRKGSALKNLAGALHTDEGECTLSVGREVKMEIPVDCSRITSFPWLGENHKRRRLYLRIKNHPRTAIDAR